MIAQNAMPFLQEVVMFMIFTPEYPLVTSCAQSKREEERERDRGLEDGERGKIKLIKVYVFYLKRKKQITNNLFAINQTND